MSIIYDDEFGKIIVRRNNRSSKVQIKLSSSGVLSASLPKYAPLFLVKRLVKNSRIEIRNLIHRQKLKTKFYNGMKIGKSHYLIIKIGEQESFKVIKEDQKIFAYCRQEEDLYRQDCYEKIKTTINKALEIEAKSYIPKRASYLAEKYDFEFNKIRLSKASGRWGSCSNSGTISLNISLMSLPFELIDYVIIHELAHTRQMNHSQDFWNIVEKINPDYKNHRKTLRSYSPSI